MFVRFRLNTSKLRNTFCHSYNMFSEFADIRWFII